MPAVLILICFLVTFKYHIRFNEERKFHELNNVNFKLSLSGSKIDKRFLGLKWITPLYRNNPNEEIILIKNVKNYLLKDTRNKMVITNYSFFSAILNEKLFAPNRWYLSDGTAYPLKTNKYFKKYNDLLINIIKKNDIAVIYTVFPRKNSIIFEYINKNCFKEKKISEVLNSYELKNCN